MKIALIGANGQLGSDIYPVLKEDHIVAPLTHKDIEITQPDSVHGCMGKINPDIIVNTAAFLDLNKCEENPEKAFLVNGIGPRNLSLWCKKNNCLLVHISTDYVFNGKKNQPYTEDDCPRPLNTYGLTKFAGELYISSILENFIIIRTAGLYGTHPCRGKSSNNFVEMFLKLIRDREVVEFGGKEVCSPTFTEDLARQLNLIIQTNKTGVFHVTSQGSCSWFEFGQEIIKKTNSRTRLIKRKTKNETTKVIRPMYTILENKRLNNLGINIMPHWKKALGVYLSKRSHNLDNVEKRNFS